MSDFCHLHASCVIAEKRMPNGYPNGQLHRKVLEEKLGRPLRLGFETHHICENPGCIEPSHLEEKPMIKHRSDHARTQKGIPHGPMQLSDEETERRREHGRKMIHHAWQTQRMMSAEEISKMKSKASSCRTVLTVRDGELLCNGCHQWKLDSDFPFDRSRKARRQRRYTCKQCLKDRDKRNKEVIRR